MPEFWGIESDEIILNIDNETIKAVELKKLGISIPGLESITDINDETIVKAKEGQRVCIEGLMTNALEVSEYHLKTTFGLGVRRCSNVTRETKGIEIKR